jgi:hypothetical protein
MVSDPRIRTMSRPDDEKPLPSAEEINAYLELSAARTKKRLPLAIGTTGAPQAPARERKLRVAGARIEAAAPLALGAELGTTSPPADAAADLTKKPAGG